MRIFISPVGTSVITNFIRRNKTDFDVYRFANFKREEYLREDLEILTELVSLLKRNALNWDIKQAKKSSAELNGLLSFDAELTSDDLLYFIVTDTLQSRLALEVINTFLDKTFGITGQEIVVKQLSTKNKTSFLAGIKELLHWSNENLPLYKESNYSIYFNLTGGFKSLLGYLTPIGMFYADSIFYIFETGELIEIPKLPIKVDESIFIESAPKFLLMAADHYLNDKELKDIPMTLLEEADTGIYGLSVWGELMWDQVRKDILKEGLIELPRLKYSSTFVTDFRNKNTDIEKVQLQETLAKVSALMIENNGGTSALKRDNGLSYENCKIKKEGETIGHFRYNGRQRVSCISMHGTLLLLRNGFHDVCN